MADYKKIQWFDKIKDQNGSTIQEGTPLSSKNFNRMENGIADAVMGVNNNSSIIKDALPSGFLKLGEYNKSYTENHLNIIRLTTKSIALINGNRLEIPEGTNITLTNPPLTGEREDLVFLECWSDQTTRELKYRIRVVEGIDFENLKEGLGILGSSNSWSGVAALGGNTNQIVLTSPISNDNCNTYLYWEPLRRNGSKGSYHYISINDFGVYVAGQGTQQDKDKLKTYDGFVYAIPMFRVWRRNSSLFSDINPNGGNLFKSIGVQNNTGKKILMGDEFELTLQDGYNTAGITSGMVLCDSSKVKYNEVLAVISDTTLKCRMLFPSGMDINGQWTQWVKQRPDQLNSDQIDSTDIIDLRHKISLVGFDYDQLLQENFERTLRGELQTNIYNRLLKTYHGIRKTPIDANTLFYCSFDGTVTPEVGANLADPRFFAIYNQLVGFAPSPTGLGALMTPINTTCGRFDFPGIKFTIDSTFTVDVGVFIKDKKYAMEPPCINVGFNSCYSVFSWGPNTLMNGNVKVGYNHFRAVVKNRTLYVYVNGNLISQMSGYYGHQSQNGTDPYNPDMFRIHILSDSNNDYRPTSQWVLFDLSISNIDRGDVFPTLPKDFVYNSAKIMPAFNEQRWCQSDALSMEYKQDVIKSASPGTCPRYIKVTQASGNWATGDKITIKGLGSECISGVLDTDTALGRILDVTSDGILTVDKTDGIIANDNITIYLMNGSLGWSDINIISVDTVNKKVTTNLTSQSYMSAKDGYLIEKTTISSVPIVKALSPTTNQLEAKAGTWTGLGTNEATFTFGTNSNLTNQDIVIEYSLIEAPGQGAFSDVLYQTLGGEINGKKLVKSDGPHIIDDFKGKVPGSIIENPNIAKRTPGSQGAVLLLEPSQFTEEFGLGGWAESIQKLDNTAFMLPCNISGSKPQQLFSFNVVEIIERKLGIIPLVDKVKWCRENISLLTFKWYGYGSCPSGNKAYIAVRNYDMNGWGGILSHDSNTIKQIVLSNIYTSALLSQDGFLNFIAYTDSSDGITTSSIFTDYISLELTLKKPSSEYDVICPVNPRRDDGLGTIAFIRKETNELRFPFKAPFNAITYGNYVPYQGTSILPKSGLYPLTDWKVIATSIGTGGYDSKGNAWAKFYKGLYNLPMYTKDDMFKFQGLPMKILGKETSITRVGYHTTSLSSYSTVLFNPITGPALVDKYYRGWKLDNFLGYGDVENGVYGIHPDMDIDGQYYLIAARLIKDSSGNIIMLIARSLGDTLFNDGGCNASDTFYLNGRPIETI